MPGAFEDAADTRTPYLLSFCASQSPGLKYRCAWDYLRGAPPHPELKAYTQCQKKRVRRSVLTDTGFPF